MPHIVLGRKSDFARTLYTLCPVCIKLGAEDLHTMPEGIRDECHESRCIGRHALHEGANEVLPSPYAFFFYILRQIRNKFDIEVTTVYF